MRRRSNLLSVAFACALLAGACGDGDNDVTTEGTAQSAASGEGLSGGDLTETSTTISVEASTTAPPATEAESTTSLAPQPTEEASAEPSTTLASPAVDGPADGVLYVDAEGVYSLLIGPDWVLDDQSLPGQFDLWFTGVETAVFAENVNVLSEPIPGALSVSEILSASESQVAAQFANFELERSEVVVGANHPELGILEYTGTSSGVDGRFLQVFGLWDGRLVVVTVSTDASLGREGIERLQPYALTVAPAG